MSNRPRRLGFTITELMVALAVGLVVVQIAFASFLIVRKYVNRIQRLEAATNLLQTAVTWYGFNGAGALPSELQWESGIEYSTYWYIPTAVGEAKLRRMPHRIVANIKPTNGQLIIYDLSSAAQHAKDNGEHRGISGHLASPPDPRILTEITLP